LSDWNAYQEWHVEGVLMGSITLAGRHGSGREGESGYFVDGHDMQQDTMSELVKDKVLLHGTLEVWIKEAKNLPNMDMFSEKFRQCFSYLTVCKAPFMKAKSKVEDKGDFGLALGFMGCFPIFQTVDSLSIFARASPFPEPHHYFIFCKYVRFHARTVICVLVLILALLENILHFEKLAIL